MTEEKTIEVYVCEICGKKYIHNQRWKSKHTCSRMCFDQRRYKINKERKKANKLKIRRKNQLEYDNAQAIAQDMTYGQWQAMKYLERKGQHERSTV